MDIINKEKLKELYGSEANALEIIKLFNDRSNLLIDEIEQCLINHDKEALARICHKGIGQARYIASDTVEDLIRKIDDASPWEAKKSPFETLKTTVADIHNAYS